MEVTWEMVPWVAVSTVLRGRLGCPPQGLLVVSLVIKIAPVLSFKKTLKVTKD